MIFKLFGIVVAFIIGAIIGLRISKDIDNGILYTLFWILYIVTYLTFANIIAVSLFYSTLILKTGPPGQRGPSGEPGEIGAIGVCLTGCKQAECATQLKEEFIRKINELAGNPVPSIELKNLLLLNQISNLCTSKQFETVAEMKGAEPATNYIKDIMNEWAKLLYDAGGKEFFETEGAEENFKWKGKNPFTEIEKYDIYYWKMNKLFKPIGVDICDDPNINKKLPQKDKPLLFAINTNIYDLTQVGDTYKTFVPRASYNEKIKYNMYPIGDVAVSGGNEIGGPKFIDNMSAPHNNNDGPAKPSLLIAGNVTAPERLERVGNFWKMIPKAGYKCIGDIAGNSATVDKYRCIPEECAERVDDNTYNGQFIYQGNGAIWGVNGSVSNGLGNDKGKENYNLFRATEGRDGHHEPFYKIKESCFNSALPTKISTGEDNWISNRWFGYPERNAKYSIFKFLGIVPEGVITNKETKNNYQFISTATEPNVYFIKFFNVGRKKYANFEVNGVLDIGINYRINRDKIEQLWYLEYTDPNKVYIRSKKTNKYMGQHYIHGENNQDEKKKHILKVLQYDQPTGNRTLWSIASTTTGQRDIEQKK